MKTPRVADFYPDAKPLPSLGSPMDHLPAIQKPNPSKEINGAIPERSNTRTVERSNSKRIITRNSFETYEDQMDSLRRLSYEEKLQGKLGSMSAMVREAIDTYILKKTSEK